MDHSAEDSRMARGETTLVEVRMVNSSGCFRQLGIAKVRCRPASGAQPKEQPTKHH